MTDSYAIQSYHYTQWPESYHALIFAKWLRSLRFGNDWFKLIDADCYYKTYHRYIENILAKPETKLRLAVLLDDPDVVLGFCVYRNDILDYCHVHKDHRKTGIARNLIPKNIKTITHLTKTGLTIWVSSPNYSHLIFNPFA